MLSPPKPPSKSAKGQRVANPTTVMIKLMLKTLAPSECLLTETTDIPEAAAESKAKISPNMRVQYIAWTIVFNYFCGEFSYFFIDIFIVLDVENLMRELPVLFQKTLYGQNFLSKPHASG